jgi:hypothetical protein
MKEKYISIYHNENDVYYIEIKSGKIYYVSRRKSIFRPGLAWFVGISIVAYGASALNTSWRALLENRLYCILLMEGLLCIAGIVAVCCWRKLFNAEKCRFIFAYGNIDYFNKDFIIKGYDIFRKQLILILLFLAITAGATILFLIIPNLFFLLVEVTMFFLFSSITPFNKFDI